jgi:heat shock protein HtpX
MVLLRRIGIFLFTNLLVMLVLGIVLQFIHLPQNQVISLLIICALFGFGGAFISLLLSKFSAKMAYRIQIVDPASATGKVKYLYDTIKQMAEYNRIRVPEIGVYQSEDSNAFATGASKNRSLIAFSTGLLNRLNEEEISAVAGHEMTHVLQGDMVTMTLLMGIVNTFVMFLARILATVLDMAMRDDRGRGGLGFFGYFLVVMVMQNVLMLLANIPLCAYSRHREYQADHGAAELTQPSYMITALEKIAGAHTPQVKADAFSLAKINNNRRMSLFATHPPIEKRIEALRKMMV